MFKKLLILTLSALLCCSVAAAADTTSMTDKARQAETQTLPSTIKHLDLVLVLDKSGSMYGLESDTIGGYNAMIAKEKDLDVDTKVTTVLFNNKVDILTDRSNINSLSDMTTKDYRVGGSTALLDAVGNTIAKISDTPGISDKDHKVIFVIITDGLENASTEYSKATIQKMISDKKAQAGTSFSSAPISTPLRKPRTWVSMPTMPSSIAILRRASRRTSPPLPPTRAVPFSSKTTTPGKITSKKISKAYFKPANLAGSMALSNCSAVTHPVFRADSFRVSPSLAACLAMVQALS